MSKIIFYQSIEGKIESSIGRKIKSSFGVMDKSLEISPAHYHCVSENSQLSIYNQSPFDRPNHLSLEIKQGESPEASILSLRVSENETRISTGKYITQLFWYYKDDHQFIFSNSQWLINQLIDGFELNEKAAKWMISTGCSADHAWDRRLKPFYYGSELVIKSNTIEHVKPDEPYYRINSSVLSLNSVIEEAFLDYKLADPLNILTLSGGFDSRVLINRINQTGKVSTASWGIKGSENEQDTDSFIAKKVANKSGNRHVHFNYDTDKLDVPVLMKKMIVAGDLRIDHVNQFMDGLKMYSDLHNAGKKVVIRGDEAFGWVPVSNPFDTLMSVGVNRVNDFKNISKNLIDFQQKLEFDSRFDRAKEESLQSWRDRLYVSFRLPFVLSALHDQMTPFLDIVNPFLHTSIIDYMRHISDDERTSKELFRRSNKGVVDEIGLSKYPSVPEPEKLLSHQDFVQFIKEKMNKIEFSELFQSLDLVKLNSLLQTQNLNNERPLNSKQGYDLSRIIPFKIKKLIRNKMIGYSLSYNRLAFRIALVQQVLEEFKKK